MTPTIEVLEDEQTMRIGAVERMTGIPANTIRVWERRYGLINPHRDETGTRLYTQQDVDYLGQVKTLIDLGESIGQIAALDPSRLSARIDALASAPHRDFGRRRRTGLTPAGVPVRIRSPARKVTRRLR